MMSSSVFGRRRTEVNLKRCTLGPTSEQLLPLLAGVEWKVREEANLDRESDIFWLRPVGDLNND